MSGDVLVDEPLDKPIQLISTLCKKSLHSLQNIVWDRRISRRVSTHGPIIFSDLTGQL